jgi:predicted acylesterase/phospholipase RssA
MPDQVKRPELQCDLVMKGGITSGIVYPPALTELAARYTFNSIGGTSAGAIAAASAAAAEYRRWSTGTAAGFDDLLSTASWLGVKNRLFKLFDAPPGTRAIIRMIDAFGGFGGFSGAGTPAFIRPATTVAKVLLALFRISPLRFVAFGALAALLFALPMGFGVYNFLHLLTGVLTGVLTGGSISPEWTAVALIALIVAITSELARKKVEVGWYALLRVVVRLLGSFLVTAGMGALLLLVLPSVLNLALIPLNWLRELANPALRAIGFPGFSPANSFQGREYPTTVLLMTLFFLAGGIVANVYHLIAGVLLKQVPKNFYGIVNGHAWRKPRNATQRAAEYNPANSQAPSKPQKPTMLTDWLSVQLDKIASVASNGAPLTFGQLCDAGITLKMISTNISHGLPYELPFKNQTEQLFIFCVEDMKRLFPGYVVHQLVKCRYRPGLALEEKLPEGYYFMPEGRDLPVIVAVRMSLAVPLFISAIPLYTLKASVRATAPSSASEPRTSPAKPPAEVQKEKLKNLQVNYFSDGGTASNFPIHFFDGWLPTRPTFGINLTALPEEAIYEASSDKDGPPGTVSLDYFSMKTQDQRGAPLGFAGAESSEEAMPTPVPTTFLPKRDEPRQQQWRPVTNPLDFIMKVIDTARENHDNLQSRLPGYSGRIIDVYLKQNEGGMNLAMSPDTMDAVMSKGREAGRTLRCDFDFDHHRWVRFLSLMSSLEVQLFNLRDAYHQEKLHYGNLIAPRVVRGPVDAATTLDGDSVPVVGQEGPYYPFTREDTWRAKALIHLQKLVELSEEWTLPGVATQFDPKPIPSPTGKEVECRDVGKCDCMLTPLTEKDRFFYDCKLKPESVLRVTPELSG